MRPQGIFRAADGRIVLQDSQGGVSVSIVPDELPPWPSALPALDLDCPDGQTTLGHLRERLWRADVVRLAGLDLLVGTLSEVVNGGALGLLCDTEVVYAKHRAVGAVPFVHLWGRGWRAAVATFDPRRLGRPPTRVEVALDPVGAMS